MAKHSSLLGIIGAALLCCAAILAPSIVLACCTPPTPPASCGCTPPPCCTPPTPPAPPTCCSPNNNVNIPGINVFVAGAVVVNASATVNASASAAAQGSTTVIGGGGGGGGFIAGPGSVGVLGALNVEGEQQRQRTAYEATRTRYEKVVIQAFCFDDRDTPHPASQVSPDRDIEDSYEGELYRCIAGAHMQVTIAKWSEKVSFDGGETMSCRKGEALYHIPGLPASAGGGGNGVAGESGGGGRLECRPQKPARDCNERSLLRRFGAGIKILTIVITEKYTAYREETRQSSSSTSSAMSLDGGVGGVVY